MNPTQAKRLMKLEARMRTFKEPKSPGKGAVGFDMRDFYMNRNQEKPCGTSACLLGHACLMPEFKRRGLVMDGGTPYYEGYTFGHAGQAFFGLTLDETDTLFYTWDKKTQGSAKAAATRIRSVVRKYYPALVTK